MKSFYLSLAALWLLGGCILPDEQKFRSERIQACGQDFTCPSGTLCFQGFCTGESTNCLPACPSYRACVEASNSSSCVDRYTLELSPANGTMVGKDPVTVQAKLTVSPEFFAIYPDHLNFAAVTSDGQAAGSFSVTSPNGVDGVYTTQWTPPTQEGTYRLTVSHPDAGGPSVTNELTVNLAPSLIAYPATAPLAAASGGFVYADANAPTAWHRDQTASVRIESDSADLDPSTISVVVHGFNGGADVTGLPVTILTDCAKRHCATVDVPLWKPSLPSFRGTFKIDVVAKDRGGLSGSASATIPVTRWKWSFNGMAGAPSSPAIGQMGTIYFGTSDTNGKVFALSPAGTKKWESPIGAVKGGLAVGAYSSATGLERVYVGANSGSVGAIFALGAGGAVTSANQCESGTILTTVALMSTQRVDETTPFETAVALGEDNSLTGLRPGASGNRNCLAINPSTAGALPRASIIAKGNDLYFIDGDTKLQAYSFSSSLALGTTWVTKSGYTAPTIGAAALGLGFSDSGYVVGAAGLTTPKSGGVFALNAADGTSLWKSPSNFAGSPARNMSIGANNTLFYGREVSGGDLTVVNLLAASNKTVVANVGNIVGAPVLGASNLFYTAISTNGASTVGELTAWNEDSVTPVWKLSDSVGLVEASPTIDCARDATTGAITPATYGILYVPSFNGSLYAFVVDSPGLDPTAPWPKYQHDVRNTGNPDTPLTACPTP